MKYLDSYLHIFRFCIYNIIQNYSILHRSFSIVGDNEICRGGIGRFWNIFRNCMKVPAIRLDVMQWDEDDYDM